MLTLLSTWWLFSLLCVCVTYRYLPRSKTSLPLPPGPRQGWFVRAGRESLPGPMDYPWLTYEKWRKIYGDTIFLHVFRNPILVLNSLETAQDLLDKKGAIYSSRPVRTMLADLMGFGFLFSTLPYNSQYKEHRNMFQKHFQAKNVSAYHAIQLKHSHTLLRNLLTMDPETPGLLDQYLRRTTAGIILEICYGHHVAEKGDEYVTLADKAFTGIAMVGAFGNYMVDYVPMLKYVPAWAPGAGFKRHALKWRMFAMEMFNQPFDMVKQQLNAGSAIRSLVSAELDSWFEQGMDRDPHKETVIKGVAATAYAAGSDTTISTLATFFLAMVLHPEAQAKASAELDRVVPHDRLPDFSDRDNLPYLDCLVWECLRWNPPGNMGLAHLLTENDEYKGYRIPKGTTVLANIWSILHDAERYPEPLEFRPERFRDKEENLCKGINGTPDSVFGFGRRICPGRWLALDTVWVVAASVLSVYKISKALDSFGNEIDPHVEYTSGLLSRPKPFQFRLEPRSREAVTQVEQTGDGA